MNDLKSEQTLEPSLKKQKLPTVLLYEGSEKAKGLKGLKELKVHPSSVFLATKVPLKIRIFAYPLQILPFALGFFLISNKICVI